MVSYGGLAGKSRFDVVGCAFMHVFPHVHTPFQGCLFPLVANRCEQPILIDIWLKLGWICDGTPPYGGPLAGSVRLLALACVSLCGSLVVCFAITVGRMCSISAVEKKALVTAA